MKTIVQIDSEVLWRLVSALKTVREDFIMLQSGDWDVSTDEGLEAAQDSIDLIEGALAKYTMSV